VSIKTESTIRECSVEEDPAGTSDENAAPKSAARQSHEKSSAAVTKKRSFDHRKDVAVRGGGKSTGGGGIKDGDSQANVKTETGVDEEVNDGINVKRRRLQ